VWRSPDALAWAQLPIGQGRPRDRGSRILRTLDSHWELAWLLVPATLTVVAAIATLARNELAAVILVIAVFAAVALALLTGLISSLLSLLRPDQRQDAVVGQMRSVNPTVWLLHAADRTGALDLLAAVRTFCRTTRPMIIHTHGITNSRGPAPGRPLLSVEPLAPGIPLLVVRGPSRGLPAATSGRGQIRIGDAATLLLSTATIVGFSAGPVANREQQLCSSTAAGCDGIPATFGDALYWMVSRLLGGDPDGLGAVDGLDRFIGVVLTVLGVYLLVTIVGRAVTHYAQNIAESSQDVVRGFAARDRPIRRTPRRPGRRSSR